MILYLGTDAAFHFLVPTRMRFPFLPIYAPNTSRDTANELS